MRLSLELWRIAGIVLPMTPLGHTQSLPQSTPKTILLVEDDSSILTLFSGTLRQQGHTVLTASSAEEALQVCRQYPGAIHLLLTDLLLPNTGELHLLNDKSQGSKVKGLDLTRQVLALRPQLLVLLMSGHPDDQLRSMGVFREKWPLLRKPLRVETLIQTVRQYLDTLP